MQNEPTQSEPTESEPTPFREGTVVLEDGRHLGYAEFGDPDGKPVLWFHGTPGARRQMPPDAPQAAAERGMKIVGVDRPGIGLSTHHSERTLLTWADDVRRLADHNGYEQFALAGLSGGGPHVLAVAYAMPERVVAAMVLGGVAPLIGSSPEAEAAPPYPQILHEIVVRLHPVREPLGILLSALLYPMRAAAEQLFGLVVNIFPEPDRPVMMRPDMKAMFLSDLTPATKSGIRAAVHDFAVFGRPWGFDVGDIKVPVKIWHGDADTTVPVSHGMWLAERIPGAEIVVVPDEGHFAGFVRAAEVFDSIQDVWSADQQAALF